MGSPQQPRHPKSLLEAQSLALPKPVESALGGGASAWLQPGHMVGAGQVWQAWRSLLALCCLAVLFGSPQTLLKPEGPQHDRQSLLGSVGARALPCCCKLLSFRARPWEDFRAPPSLVNFTSLAAVAQSPLVLSGLRLPLLGAQHLWSKNQLFQGPREMWALTELSDSALGAAGRAMHAPGQEEVHRG